MDFFNKIELIKDILNRNGYKDVAAIILDAQLSGGTGGEVLIMVCSKLLTIKQRNKEIYSLIKSDAEELIAYAKSIGLEPRAT